MRQQAEILLDVDLANFLAEDPELDVHIHELDEAGVAQALRLTIPDPATIITVVAASAEIANYLLRVAHRIKAWMKARNHSTTQMILRGETEDSVLEVNDEMQPEELGRILLIRVYEEPTDDPV